jgi:hypothetical protein
MRTAQIDLICTPELMSALGPQAAPNGGSGALDCGLTVRLGHRCFSDEASHVNA